MRDFHPNTPKRLIAAVRAAGSERKFARSAGINILYVSQLLGSGIEPTDRTEKGREVRVKLFLPKTKPKPRKPGRPLLPGEWKTRRIIGRMAKDTAKDVLITKDDR